MHAMNNLQAKSWLRGSEPVVPCFAIMYLKTERGRPPQIVWTGVMYKQPLCRFITALVMYHLLD